MACGNKPKLPFKKYQRDSLQITRMSSLEYKKSKTCAFFSGAINVNFLPANTVFPHPGKKSREFNLAASRVLAILLWSSGCCICSSSPLARERVAIKAPAGWSSRDALVSNGLSAGRSDQRLRASYINHANPFCSRLRSLL